MDTDYSSWQLRIERVNKDELESLVDVYRESYKGLEEYADTERSKIINYLHWLYNRDRDGFFVAKLNGKIVGFIASDAGWKPYHGEIHEFVVLPQYREHGIGRKLFQKALDYLKSKGIKFVGLWLGEKNSNAKDFYSHFGVKFIKNVGIWEKWGREL